MAKCYQSLEQPLSNSQTTSLTTQMALRPVQTVEASLIACLGQGYQVVAPNQLRWLLDRCPTAIEIRGCFQNESRGVTAPGERQLSSTEGC